MKKLVVFLMVATALLLAGCHEAEETTPGVTVDAPDTVVVTSVYSYNEALRNFNEQYRTHPVACQYAKVYTIKHNGHQYLMFTVTGGCGHHGSMSASVVHDPDCPCQEVKGPGFGVRSNNEQAPGPQITL